MGWMYFGCRDWSAIHNTLYSIPKTARKKRIKDEYIRHILSHGVHSPNINSLLQVILNDKETGIPETERAHRPSHPPGLPQGLPDGVWALTTSEHWLWLRQVCKFYALKGCRSNPASLCLNYSSPSTFTPPAALHLCPSNPSSSGKHSSSPIPEASRCLISSLTKLNLRQENCSFPRGLPLMLSPPFLAQETVSLYLSSTEYGQVPSQPLLMNIFQGQPQPTPDTQKGKRTSWASRQITKNICSYHSFRNFCLISLSVSMI